MKRADKSIDTQENDYNSEFHVAKTFNYKHIKPNEHEIEMLEKKLSSSISAYAELKNSDKNSQYFNTLYLRVSDKLDNAQTKKKYSFLESRLSYAFLFLISFIISYNIINNNTDNYLEEDNYIFSTSLSWFEEEEYYSDLIIEDNIDLDYENYLSNELNYYSTTETIELLSNLSEDELNEIYNNIKYKKML